MERGSSLSVGVSARTREGIPAGTCAAAGGVIPEKCQSCPSILPGKGRRCVFVLRSCRKDVLGAKLHPPCFCSCSLAGEPAEPGSHSPAPDPPARSRGAPAGLQWGLGGWGRGCGLFLLLFLFSCVRGGETYWLTHQSWNCWISLIWLLMRRSSPVD